MLPLPKEHPGLDTEILASPLLHAQRFVASFVAGLVACMATTHYVGAAPQNSEVARASGYWIPNGGQWPEEVLFASSGPGCEGEIWVDRKGFVLQESTQKGPGSVHRCSFAEVLEGSPSREGASSPLVVGVETLDHRHSFFLGRDPARWAGGLPAYGALELDGTTRVYPGKGGLWVGDIATGFRRIFLGADGNADGAPAIVPPQKLVVPFAEGDWSSYFGGDCTFNIESSGDACVTGDGDVLVQLITACLRPYPQLVQNLSAPGVSTAGLNPDLDNLVGRFDGATGRLVWIARIGGSHNELSTYIIETPDGRIALAGSTNSKDLPITDDAIDKTFPPPLTTKGYLTLLSASGDAIEYSSYLGLASNFVPDAIAVEPAGRLAVGGICADPFSSSLEAWQKPGWPDPLTPNSGSEAGVVVFRLDTMVIDYAGLFGGSSAEWIHAMVFDSTGALTVVGRTGSSKQSFPTTPGTYTIPTILAPGWLFVTRIAPDGNAFEFSAWIGQTVDNFSNLMEAIVLPDRSTVIAGRTSAATVPVTPGVLDPVLDFNGTFLMQLKPDGKGLAWASYFGGFGLQEQVSSLEADSSGMLTLVCTHGEFIPNKTYGATAGYFQMGARIAPGATKLLYSIALREPPSPAITSGGGLLPGSRIAIAGTALTPAFPVSAGAFDPQYSGIYDGYVAGLSLLPEGIRHLEGSGSTCSAGLTLGATRSALPGETEFSLYLSGGPPAGLGVMAFGQQSGIPLDLAGTLSWIDPASAPAILPLTLGPKGFIELPLPIPAGVSGAELAVQAFLLPPPGCGQGLVSSHGLAIRFL